jgi:hypothetical protein
MLERGGGIVCVCRVDVGERRRDSVCVEWVVDGGGVIVCVEWMLEGVGRIVCVPDHGGGRRK